MPSSRSSSSSCTVCSPGMCTVVVFKPFRASLHSSETQFNTRVRPICDVGDLRMSPTSTSASMPTVRDWYGSCHKLALLPTQLADLPVTDPTRYYNDTFCSSFRPFQLCGPLADPRACVFKGERATPLARSMCARPSLHAATSPLRAERASTVSRRIELVVGCFTCTWAGSR